MNLPSADPPFANGASAFIYLNLIYNTKTGYVCSIYIHAAIHLPTSTISV